MDGYNPFSLEGKTILITGASSGIGRAIATACSRMGATVVATGRNVQKLEATMEVLESEMSFMYPADLTKIEDVKELVINVSKLDGVVHCAGIGQRVPCKNVNSENIDEVLAVNFKAPVLLMSSLLQLKKINKGRH